MRRTQADWARIVARYRKSGLSVRRFSTDEGISEQSLRNWTRKVVGPESIHERKDTGFVEIVRTGQPGPLDGNGLATAAGAGLVIWLESGACIEVRPETDRDLLGWVLTVLGRAS